MQVNDRMKERRRTTRAPCDLPVTWLRRGKVVVGSMRDINADGFFLLTPETVAQNPELDAWPRELDGARGGAGWRDALSHLLQSPA